MAWMDIFNTILYTVLGTKLLNIQVKEHLTST